MYKNIQADPFALSFSNRFNNSLSFIGSMIERRIEDSLGLTELSSMYANALTNTKNHSSFYDAILDEMQCTYEVDGMEHIPKSGPVIIVANHPFGGIEGVILGSLLGNIRSDVKIMANSLLERIPQFHSSMIFVNPFGGNEAVKENLKGVKEAIQWLKNGGILGVFPAGEVSHYQPEMRKIADPEWNTKIVRIAKMTNATIIPMFIHGHNSRSFQIIGLIHPRLRTMALPREYLKMKDAHITITIGKPVQQSLLKSFNDDYDCTRYIRQRTYVLQLNRKEQSIQPMLQQEEITSTAREEIEHELSLYTREDILAESGDYCVYIAKADKQPGILREIGRLRECAFREVGEGTGKALDLDIFDSEYEQLILHKKGFGIIGGYRIGRTDHLRNVFGKNGLYTQTLFHYSRGFHQRIPKGLELGRAFICKEFQRSFLPLQLLWKGIGAYIIKQKHYRYLFGSVSISNAYHPLSKQLIITYLKEHCFDQDFASVIKAKHPFMQSKHDPTYHALIGSKKIHPDIEVINSMIMEIEPDDKGIPILIRQYMKLGGKFCGFGIDPAFNDSVDCLVIIDLLHADESILARYMSEDGLKEFRNFHFCKPIQYYSHFL
jgi:putative hemolysin